MIVSRFIDSDRPLLAVHAIGTWLTPIDEQPVLLGRQVAVAHGHQDRAVAHPGLRQRPQRGALLGKHHGEASLSLRQSD